MLKQIKEALLCAVGGNFWSLLLREAAGAKSIGGFGNGAGASLQNLPFFFFSKRNGAPGQVGMCPLTPRDSPRPASYVPTAPCSALPPVLLGPCPNDAGSKRAAAAGRFVAAGEAAWGTGGGKLVRELGPSAPAEGFLQPEKVARR